MAVRRHAARLAAVCALVGGVVALSASPALADEDSVRMSTPDSFRAGGSAEGVSVEVRKRTDGCVGLRTALGLSLDGLRPEQVRVQVNVGGNWYPAPVSGGGGGVSTAAISPANPRLCKGKSITMRYRVAFAADTAPGHLGVTAEASNLMGQVFGRDEDSSRVAAGRATASPTPSKKPSSTPSVVATEAATAEEGTPAAALADPAGGATTNVAEESSGGSPIMFFGLALVAVGVVLMVLLYRRFREDKEEPTHPVSGPLPTNPGGGTYQSAWGPAAVPGQPGPVYGQQPPSPGVYGSAHRPSGGVYGARPAGAPDATQVMPGLPTAPPSAGRHAAPPTSRHAAPSGASDAPTSTPPAPARYGTPSGAPTSAPPVPGQYGEPSGAPTSAPPVSGPPGPPPAAPRSAPPAPGQPGSPPAPSGEGDHTMFMPRLPG